jgi:hypothetical protein
MLAILQPYNLRKGIKERSANWREITIEEDGKTRDQELQGLICNEIRGIPLAGEQVATAQTSARVRSSDMDIQ